MTWLHHLYASKKNAPISPPSIHHIPLSCFKNILSPQPRMFGPICPKKSIRKAARMLLYHIITPQVNIPTPQIPNHIIVIARIKEHNDKVELLRGKPPGYFYLSRIPEVDITHIKNNVKLPAIMFKDVLYRPIEMLGQYARNVYPYSSTHDITCSLA